VLNLVITKEFIEGTNFIKETLVHRGPMQEKKFKGRYMCLVKLNRELLNVGK
jgi:hypothetical protein